MRNLMALPIVLLMLWPTMLLAEPATTIEVWRDPGCGCCGKWVEHLRANGFAVNVHNTHGMRAVKQSAGVPAPLRSCHTAKVDGYVIEGHVPAADIKRLLAERSKIKGLAVPGMPMGSPGMETGAAEPYRVIAFDADGTTRTYAAH